MTILKRVLAVFVGIMFGGLVVWAVEMLGHSLYPPPANFDFNDKNALDAFITNAPFGSKLFIIIAYASGSFIGGLITQLIAQTKTNTPSLITGTFLMIAGIMNMLNIPHPLWMVISCVAVFIPFAYLGGFVIRKKPNSELQ